VRIFLNLKPINADECTIEISILRLSFIIPEICLHCCNAKWQFRTKRV